MAKSIRVPSYCLHRASGRGRVYIAGRWVMLPGEHGSAQSLAAYDRAIADWRAAGCPTRRERLQADTAAAGALSVGELVLAWWQAQERIHAGKLATAAKLEPAARSGAELAANRWLSNRRPAVRALNAVARTAPVGDFGPQDFVRVRDAMLSAGWARNGGEHRPLSRVVVNRRMVQIVALFRWGVRNGLVPPAVLHGLASVEPLRAHESAATESPRVRAVALELVHATLEHLPETVAVMVQVQLATGARPGEVCAMSTGDIDQSGELWCYRPAWHKLRHRGIDREIWLPRSAQQLIAPRLQRDLARPLFLRVDDPPTPYDGDTYRSAVHRACRAAGVPTWNPNQLRHTRATQIRSTYGLDAASAVLGHNNVQTTQVYAELRRELALDVARRSG